MSGAPKSRAMRIVSLLPSATEIVCALGLEDRLVGVTHECDYPPGVRTRPHVTRSLIPPGAPAAAIDRAVKARLSGAASLYALDAERLRALAPDLIISQTLCSVCAVAESEVKAALRGMDRPPRVLYLEPTRLEEVFHSILLVGRAADVESRARALVISLRQRLARIRQEATEGGPERPPDWPRSAPLGVTARVGRGDPDPGDRLPRVVVLEWLDPLFASGHWTPELVAACGAVEPLGRAGERSREIDERELVEADPDMLLIACCGFDVERTMKDVPSFLSRPAVAGLRCVQAGRVYVTDGSAYFSRPGPRLADSAEILAHALDPVRHALPAGLPAAVCAI